MTVVDQLLLLVTGLTALYLVATFYREYRGGGKEAENSLYYMVAFAVVLVAGLLLIGLGYGVLANPLVVIVSTLIPLALALGLVGEFYPEYQRSYLLFAIAGLLAIAVTRFTGPSGVATGVLALVHSVAGLTIFFTPIAVWRRKARPAGFIMVTVGGTLIGIGGIALAFLKAGRPILPADVIFAILAPLLLLMTASFAWGFVKGR